MRKCIAIIVIALLVSCSMSYASVGYKKDGEPMGNAISIDFRNGNTTSDGSTVTFYANGYKDGVTTNVSTESNLTSAAVAYGIIKLEAGSAKSIALADGTAGQMVTIMMSVYDGKTITITDDQVGSSVFTMTKTGWDDIAFDSVFDTVTLLFVDSTYGWVISGMYGVTVT